MAFTFFLDLQNYSNGFFQKNEWHSRTKRAGWNAKEEVQFLVLYTIFFLWRRKNNVLWRSSQPFVGLIQIRVLTFRLYIVHKQDDARNQGKEAKYQKNALKLVHFNLPAHFPPALRVLNWPSSKRAARPGAPYHSRIQRSDLAVEHTKTIGTHPVNRIQQPPKKIKRFTYTHKKFS